MMTFSTFFDKLLKDIILLLVGSNQVRIISELYMEKKKEKSLTSARSRTKKDPLAIEGEIKIVDGIYIKGAKGLKRKDHEPINIKLRISRDDMIRLYSLISDNPNYFMQGFYIEFVLPALEYMDKGARGKFKGKGITLHWLKMDASELYHLFKFIIRNKKNPSYFKKLLEEIDKLDNKDQFYIKVYNKDKRNPIALTAYCIEQYLKNTDKPLEYIGVKPLLKRVEGEGELESFYKHQIKGYKPIITYDKEISDEALEDLAKDQPFNLIFKILNLI